MKLDRLYNLRLLIYKVESAFEDKNFKTMFSNPPVLSDFVGPIPYCQPQTNPNSILDIFHRWNCQQIAIHQKNDTWGIIESTDLLSLITEVHLNQKIVAHSRFRSVMHQQTISGLNSQSLSLIVKPAVVYQSSMRLDEFLSLLPKGSLGCDRQKYLIVDTGELQGKLDKNKILEYLASEYKSNSTVRRTSIRLNHDIKLLDSIAVPLKIKTTSGEDLYFNSCWRELIIGDRYTRQKQQPKSAIASWWIEQQQLNTLNQNSPTKAQCTVVNYLSDYLSVLFPSFSSGSTSKPTSNPRQEISTELDLKIDINSVSKKQENQSSKSTRTQLKIRQFDNWNYVTIPLTDANQEYQLVVALEAESSAFLPKSIVNQLLATVTHELKSPLTGIVGLSNLLESQLGQLNQRQARYLKLIHSSGRKMMGIVNDLIKLTALTEKSCRVESESIDLDLLCRQVYQQLLKTTQSLEISNLEAYNSNRLELDSEPHRQIAIANKSHLSCILFHLMMEAIEFAKSPERLKIKISSLSESIKITISNALVTNGYSESNYNIDFSLRLAMVKYLIEFIEGDLKSDCSLGRCQFTLLLPIIESDRIPARPATANTSATETAKRNLTILCLYPEAEAIGNGVDCHNNLDFNLKSWQDASKNWVNYRHRIIEANGLEQAHTLARIWQLDVIILQGDRLSNPLEYLQLLQTSKYLSAVPLITLDNKTTQAANKTKDLSVYPYLLPAEHRQIEDLMQVIQIAVG